MLASLRPGMLLLADRGYDGFEALRDAAATGADLLWRVQAGRPDGTSHASTVRLVTTLLDPQRYPAAPYHER
ncbi:hypothetical protein [Streptomyces bluensis]|uniref:hypothetical protein n=1 Tax=Streptomyces bluensis TaxID=33897 RepID=UPI0033191A9F